ncbi:MAG: ABC transporter ATP-binding protein [Alphaproteobacteria bacterium]
MTLLEARSLTKMFGGLRAVADVSFDLSRGQIRAIIGPNGAGKSTLVGLISGRVPPSAGRIVLEGRDVTELPAWRRVRLGIAYTFQITSVFGNLNCHDNVALAAQRSTMSGIGGRLRPNAEALRALAAAALARVGLDDAMDRRAATLPYGHQRLLEVAMGLALAPKLLIMDEPTQGLSEDEIDRYCRLVREIAGATTILLIEHNMAVVMALADVITVLDQGRVLAEGTPEAIRADPAVREAYLGT